MTRVIKLSAFALLSVMILWACGGEALGPKETGEKFLTALNSGDYSTAKKYATEAAGKALDQMKNTKAKNATLEFGELEENGDKATLNYTEDGSEKSLPLVKEGDSWKAVWSKPNVGEEIGKGLNEAFDGLEEGVKGMNDAMKGASEEMDDALNGGDEEEEMEEDSHEGHDH